MAGDYTKFQRHYQSLTTDFALVALTPSPTTVLTARNSAFAIYLQKVELVVTTFVASVVSLVGATSGKVYARFDVPGTAPANGTEYYSVDYGPTGSQVTVGENVNLSYTVNGVVGIFHFEAYQRYFTSGALNAQSGAPA